MADHIFTASVRSRIADTRRSLAKADEAYERLKDCDSTYAREVLALGLLHRRVLDIWTEALNRAREDTDG